LLFVLFEGYRLLLRALVVLMAVHFFASTFGYLRRRSQTPRPAPKDPWPRVTIQLPIRNEFYAASRVLEAVSRFDYPRELLEIQVLDDSDDGTSEQLAALVARLEAEGFDVVHLRRREPTGFKAGALQAGLERARGEFVAMFDADFVPAPDFLKRILPHFDHERVAMVQGVWAHMNREQNWLTRLQAQLIDGLFVVEQTAKSRAGLPFQFNGTAGVWRRAAIDDVGGWTFDSLTEDLDLSIRAQLTGWRLVHVPEVSVPCELPTSLAMFRVQQRRWALGTAQLLRKRVVQILTAELPLRSRIAIVTQLGRHLVHPLIVLLVLTVPLTTFAGVPTLFDYGWANAAILGLLATGIAVEHAVAASAVGQRPIRAALLAPMIIPLAIGLAPTYTVALFYGLRDRAGAFFRTPKVLRAPRAGEPVYRPLRSWLVIGEIGIGVAYSALAAYAALGGLGLDAAFFVLVAFAFLWLGLGSLRTRPEAPDEAPAAAGVEAVPIYDLHRT
jgi:cellulose synthase/poly-beta-1,6-N-acetylglucosamine synthase-like glycosyltransferase